MDIMPECVPCLMKRVLFQAKLADNGTEFDSVSAALKAYSAEFAYGRNSAAIATEVHKAAYNAMGVRDPYCDLKIKADEVAGEYVSYARDYIDRSENRMKAAALMAVIGNIMDFGSGIAIDHPDAFRQQFDRIVSQGIGSDDTDMMETKIRESRTVVYIFDNCGESQFDLLLIEEIKRLGVRVVGVVRGEPILNDVTAEDAKRIGLDKVLDRMLTTGQFAIGADLDKVGEDLRKEINRSDLIIAKGMANYEAFSDQITGHTIVYILRSKCVPVARSLDVPLDINVVRFVDK